MAAFNQFLILYHLKTPENQIISSGVFMGYQMETLAKMGNMET